MAAPLQADTGVDLGINRDFLEHVGYKSTTYCAMGLHTVFTFWQGTSIAALLEAYTGAHPGAKLQVVAYVSSKHTTMCVMRLPVILKTWLQRAGSVLSSTTRDSQGSSPRANCCGWVTRTA